MNENFEKYDELIKHLQHIYEMRHQAIKWAIFAEKELMDLDSKYKGDVEQLDLLRKLLDRLGSPFPHDLFRHWNEDAKLTGKELEEKKSLFPFRQSAETCYGVDTK